MQTKQGVLEVICGGMFSGKTEELIRRVRRAIYAKQKVQVFKPCIDDRYSSTDVVSHSGQTIKSIPVDSISEMLDLVSPDTAVVAIDEVQFFDPQTAGAINQLAETYRVICAGLKDVANQCTLQQLVPMVDRCERSLAFLLRAFVKKLHREHCAWLV